MEMTEQNKKEIEKNYNGLLILLKEIVSIRLASKTVQDKTNTFLIKAVEHVKKYGDTSIFRKLFFLKVGKTYAYNTLNLKNYFEENGVCFVYNVKKDSLKIFGNYENIKETYLDYLERKKQERREELATETKEQKIERLFKSKIESLSESEKVLLKEYLKTI